VQPELAAVIGAERFLNEIKVTANLQHPNILPLFESGRTGGQADGRAAEFLYYVMPYVKGESLRALLNRKKQLPIDQALEITKVVASALGHAHRQGVIHRDIKPENILLADDGQPLVADFGIALAVTEAGGTRLTETGMSLGTPEYMSPEQATGDRQLEPASDIYSLGAVLYEMLVGDPPHHGEHGAGDHSTDHDREADGHQHRPGHGAPRSGSRRHESVGQGTCRSSADRQAVCGAIRGTRFASGGTHQPDGHQAD
jgi:serine/threonine protein kinase